MIWFDEWKGLLLTACHDNVHKWELSQANNE